MTVTIGNLKDGNSEGFVVAGQTIAAAASPVALTSFPAITASYTGGVLTLSGNDTVSDYQRLLTMIKYQDRAASPNTSPRIVTVVVNDAISASNVGTSTIDFTTAQAAADSSVSSSSIVSNLVNTKAVDKVMASLANLLAR
jgi:hypothetical protein